MKHLSIIASGITLISSYSFTAEYNATINNNLPKDTIKIFSVKGHPCTLDNPCVVPPNTIKKIPVDIYKTQAIMVITTTSMKGADYMIEMPKPLPQNINFTQNYEQGHNYLTIFGDGKFIAKMLNEPRNFFPTKK